MVKAKSGITLRGIQAKKTWPSVLSNTEEKNQRGDRPPPFSSVGWKNNHSICATKRIETKFSLSLHKKVLARAKSSGKSALNCINPWQRERAASTRNPTLQKTTTRTIRKTQCLKINLESRTKNLTKNLKEKKSEKIHLNLPTVAKLQILIIKIVVCRLSVRYRFLRNLSTDFDVTLQA